MINQVTGPVLHDAKAKKASTDFALESFVEFVDGFIQPATPTTKTIYGVCDKAVTSADADYALNTQIPVALPNDTSTFLVDVVGDIDDVVIGERRDLASAVAISATLKAVGQVTVVGKRGDLAEVIVNSFVGYKDSNES